MHATTRSTSFLSDARKALLLALASIPLLFLGAATWNFEYESRLVLLPVGGCIAAGMAVLLALPSLNSGTRPSTEARLALALGVYTLLSSNPPFVCELRYGWMAGIPFLCLFVWRLDARDERAPLILALIGLVVLAVALPRGGLIVAPGLSACLATVGLWHGATLLEQRRVVTTRLYVGLMLDLALLVIPGMCLMLYLAGED